MLSTYRFGLVVALSLLTAGCGGDMAVASHVVNLRVLAVRADPPEVRAPEGSDFALTSVDALVVGEQGALSYAWSLCLIPGPVFDGRTCLDPNAEIPLGADSSETIPVPSPEVMLAQAPPEFQGFEVDLSSGVPVQVQLEVTDESGRSLTAIKTLTISDREVTNTNPTLEGITLAGQPWDAGVVIEVEDADVELDMVPEWPPESQEVHDDDGVESTESLLFSWFIDDEESVLAKERSSSDVPENSITPGPLDEADERLVTLWLVARDDRGGVTWMTRQLRIVRGE